MTNTGSFEKCWRLVDGVWWMYKNGIPAEFFSELFICLLGEKLGLDMAHYELDGHYIRSKNFVHATNLILEPISSIMDKNDDYSDCFYELLNLSPALAEQYLRIVWMDTLCYNMDRHTENFGFLRDVHSGQIVSMAPNYDNNIALIARGYLNTADRTHDGLIRFFRDFVQENQTAKKMYQEMVLPSVTEDIINACLGEIPIPVNRAYILSFILNGWRIMNTIIDEDAEENAHPII